MPLNNKDQHLKEILDSYEDHIKNYHFYTGNLPQQAMELIYGGANSNVLNTQGNSLLHLFTLNGRYNQETQKYIDDLVLTYKLNIDIVNAQKFTPLQIVLNELDKTYPFIFDTPSFLIATQLIDLGADPNVKSAHKTYLHILVFAVTISKHCKDTFYSLIKNERLLLDVLDSKNQTPLQFVLTQYESKNYSSGVNPITIAMELVRHGANPNVLNQFGNSFIHVLTRNSPAILSYQQHLQELILNYHANIDILNSTRKTALENLYEEGKANNNHWSDSLLCSAATLLRYGSHKNNLSAVNKDFLAAIEVRAKKKALRPFSKIESTARSNFINMLFYLALNWQQDNSTSSFSKLPLETILHVMSYLDFEKMAVTWQEGYQLASYVFQERHIVKEMAAKPGGINIFQEFNYRDQSSSFTLFKSATTLCLDYNKKQRIKKTDPENLVDKLNPLEAWRSHASLFKQSGNKARLTRQLLKKKLYQRKEFKKLMNP